jgi:hypothetical protein
MIFDYPIADAQKIINPGHIHILFSATNNKCDIIDTVDKGVEILQYRLFIKRNRNNTGQWEENIKAVRFPPNRL